MPVRWIYHDVPGLAGAFEGPPFERRLAWKSTMFHAACVCIIKTPQEQDMLNFMFLHVLALKSYFRILHALRVDFLVLVGEFNTYQQIECDLVSSLQYQRGWPTL